MMCLGQSHASLLSWWSAALTSPVTLTCGGLIVLLLVLGLFTLRAAVRLAPGPAGRAAGCRAAAGGGPVAERGTATIEFALILPILLTIILLLVQTTLVMGGNIFVHYSAFAAARSAVVQIPAEYDGEPVNWYSDAPGSPKRDAIHRSAAMALLPVAGPNGTADDDAWLAPGVSEGLAAMHRRLGDDEPPWVAHRVPGRVRYALQHTAVQVLRMESDAEVHRLTHERVGPRDAVAVHVEHRLHLPIPYVNRIFADARMEDDSLTMRLAARSMLTNFGHPDQLPDEPALRRIPQ